MKQNNYTFILIAIIGAILISMFFKPSLFKMTQESPEQELQGVVDKAANQSIHILNEKEVKEFKKGEPESPWDDMLTTKELLPKTNDAWQEYGCDTFVPKTDDLLAASATPSRVSAMFPTAAKTSRNWDLRGSIQVPIDSNIQSSMLLAKPDGFGTPYEDRRTMELH